MPTATVPVPLKVSSYWPPGLPGENWRQAAFLSVSEREVLFGGAAGPGKTMGLFMAALQYVDVPGYAAILLRRTYRQLALPGQLLDMARRTLAGTDAKWNREEARFEFPSGAVIVFGHLDSDRDLEDALGPTYQFIGFDELTQFPEHHYLELFARLRRPKDPDNPLSKVPLRVRGASNPGGRGHRWVKQRFMVEPTRERLFIPAKLADNPGIDAESYIESLMELSPHRRAQMLDGDWDAKPVGPMFDREWFPILDRGENPETLVKIRYWDAAATQPTDENPDPDWTAGCLFGVDDSTGDYYVLDFRHARVRPGGVEKLVLETANIDGNAIPICFEQEPGASGKHMIKEWQDKLPGYDVSGHLPGAAKEVRAAPVAARAERGRVFLIEGPWITEFLDEVEDFPEGDHDDQVDAISGAYATVKRQRVRRYKV